MSADYWFGLALTILAALWIARACYVEAQRKVDVLLAANEAERERQAGIQAGFDAGWHGGNAA